MKALKKIDKVRLIAINNDNLLVLEKGDVIKKYSLPGGVKKKTEVDYNSLIRETYEEIDVKLKENELTYFLSIKSKNKAKQLVYKYYFTTTKPIEKIKLNEPDKFKNVLWVPWQEALDYLDKEDRSAVIRYYK
ncbi:NUDIX hydrolase [Pontimicrobium sp. MEBiC01747]